MPTCWTQVLSQGQDADFQLNQIVHHLVNFFLLLSQAQHHPRLGDNIRGPLLGTPQKLQ